MIFRMRAWNIVRHFLLAVGLVALSLFLLLIVSFLGLDLAYAGHVFRGVYVQGIPIGGLSREEALEKLRSELDLEALSRDLVLEFDGNIWPLPLYEIDAYVDLEETVDRAVAASRQIPFYRRWANRAAFRGLERDIGLVVRYDARRLDEFLSELESTVDRPPLDAEIRLEGKRLIFQRSRDGWDLDANLARESILKALASPDRVVRLQIEVTKPQVSDDQVGKVIVVDKTNHRLTLYNNMEVERQYPVAVGMPSWPTPTGTFKIVTKERNPTWVNPGTSWAANMPPYIPPGPGNPLGTCALGTSAPGVFIHGTYSSWSIGYSVSHGCIRMYIRDAEDLFERVQIGTPVLIY
ncbi:L,D-transpeptidase/peptidoglycan binding protein [Candidatus Solincola tengchongensis]|uniref:L,D-transpeptidase family protein n=1 Tax=Candidatus Solincola tengchongensis TaxID=2900693 RepID=UPI00257ABEEE|nr:L,D-transpeptidase/peptidoglycan binding protein [Candidatus Solincola tengchongensis]